MGVLASRIFQHWYGTAEVREIFSDRNTVQQWLNVEAALARAEAEVGVIPQRAAEAIAAKADASLIPLDALRDEYITVGYPILPLLKVWQRHLGEEAAGWVHWGATTQDITDTAMVLQLRQALNTLEPSLRALIDALKTMARQHRQTVTAARTHGQQAVPTTFGWKVAMWIAELRRHVERLAELKPRLLVGQLGGAAGTLASLGEKGRAVQEGMMKQLGLGVTPVPWHSARDSFSAFAAWMAMVGSTLEKMAHEVEMLQKTEVAELEESFEPGKGASSTMPQKRNPATSEAIIALGHLLRAQVPAVMASMTQEHERDWWAIHVEWKSLSEMCLMLSAALAMTDRLMGGLRVNADKMRENLQRSRGLVMAEAVMMCLSSRMGRMKAHDLLYRVSAKAFAEDRALAEVLKEEPEVCAYLTAAQIDQVLDPLTYLGQALSAVERVLEEP